MEKSIWVDLFVLKSRKIRKDNEINMRTENKNISLYLSIMGSKIGSKIQEGFGILKTRNIRIFIKI